MLINSTFSIGNVWRDCDRLNLCDFVQLASTLLCNGSILIQQINRFSSSFVRCFDFSMDSRAQSLFRCVGGWLESDSANSRKAVAAKSVVVPYLADHCSISL